MCLWLSLRSATPHSRRAIGTDRNMLSKQWLVVHFSIIRGGTLFSYNLQAIYLAAFLYLKDSFQIDFDLDYFSDGLLDEIPSGNFPVADKVFSYMMKYGEGHYGAEERDFGVSGYKMNIQLTPDYGSYIKNYFIRAHKIGSGKDFTVFSSPRNCLWKSGIKSIDSPTQRDVYYKFDGNNFEFMIPPYNPLVTGCIVEKTATTLRCESGDGRSQELHFISNSKK